jgi:hypothetical protein
LRKKKSNLESKEKTSGIAWRYLFSMWPAETGRSRIPSRAPFISSFENVDSIASFYLGAMR